MKVAVISRKGFGKAGRRLLVPRDHANFLVRSRLADYEPETKAIVAAEVKPATLTLPSKARYARRDMVAATPAPTWPQVPIVTRGE